MVVKRAAPNAQIADLLHSVCRVWSSHSKCDLQIPPQLQIDDPAQLKEFCVGLLENPDAHPWKGPLSRADGRKALSVAGSLFLFRKAVPAVWDEAEMVRAHRSNLVPDCRKARDPLPSGYLQHVRKIVASQFPAGWDKGYRGHCWSSTPSVGSCTGSSRANGGNRALRPCRATFLRRTLGQEAFKVDNLIRYTVVATGGKGRGVTVASPEMGVLHPLHKTTYDHLSTLPWLLRGEAVPGRFRRFQRREGEVFVSGDYESATDNLRVEVAMTVLDVMQSSAKYVPASVWEAARDFLHCRIQYPDLNVPVQSEGQLMGNLLCFPLLCIQNYVAFRWVFSEDVPVKINGDDIVFRSRRDQYLRWADFVSSVGLKLSRGKTLVHEIYFSLNSSFFWSRVSGKPRPIPVTRVSAFTKPFEDWGSLSGSFRSLTRGYAGEAKLEAECLFLERFRRRILQAGRSVVRGLGVKVSKAALRKCGLWRRECWYADSVPEELDCLPLSPCRLKWGSVPDGWERKPRTSITLDRKVRFVREGESLPPPIVDNDRIENLAKAFWSQLVAETWITSPTRGQLTKEYQHLVQVTGQEVRYRAWKTEREVVLRGGLKAPRSVLRPRLAIACGFSQRLATSKTSDWRRKWRIPRDAAERFFESSARVPLVWVPVAGSSVEQENWSVSVSDLLDYEGLSFESPESFGDPRYYLGHC